MWQFSGGEHVGRKFLATNLRIADCYSNLFKDKAEDHLQRYMFLFFK